MNGVSVRYAVCGIEYAVAEPLSTETSAETAVVIALPTLICMHGIGGDHMSFAPQLESLGSRYRVIAWNMPGYRGSAPLPDMTFAKLAAKLNEFRNELKLENVHLVGQSIGGMIAQEFAVRYPAQVATMTLIATTAAFGGRDDSFRDQFLEARLAPLDAGRTMPDLAREFVPAIVGDIATAAVTDAATLSMAAVPVSTYRDVVTCLVTFDQRASLIDYTAPVCLIAGELDQNAPARTMQKMSEKINGAQFHTIAGAGHLVNLEAPEACNTIIANFIEAGHGH